MNIYIPVREIDLYDSIFPSHNKNDKKTDNSKNGVFVHFKFNLNELNHHIMFTTHGGDDGLFRYNGKRLYLDEFIDFYVHKEKIRYGKVLYLSCCHPYIVLEKAENRLLHSNKKYSIGDSWGKVIYRGVTVHIMTPKQKEAIAIQQEDIERGYQRIREYKF